jgi:hypothetical protein
MISARRPVSLLAKTGCLGVMASSAAAETVTLPSGAATGSAQSVTIYSTSCPSAGDCVAVGEYRDSAGNPQGLIATEINGAWSYQEADLTGLSVEASPEQGLRSVACASTGNCVAVGYYYDSADVRQGLIETDTNGNWQSSKASLSGLSVSSSSPDQYLSNVACGSAGNCVATGSYRDGSSYQQGLIATETNGVWSYKQASLSGLITDTSPGVQFESLSCASVGNCAATATYYDAGGGQQGLIETETNGGWSVSQVNLANLTTNVNPLAQARSVSCASAGNCSLVGTYQDPSGSSRPMAETEQNGIWHPAIELALPANAGSNIDNAAELHLNSVSCASSGDCVAVGSYDATSADDVEAVVLTQTAGTWSIGVQFGYPTAAASNPSAALDSVSCGTSGACAVAGTYEDNNATTQALIAQRSDGNWSSTNLQVAGQPYGFDENAASTSCSPDGYCAIFGDANGQAPFLVDAPGAVSAPSASIHATPAAVGWASPSNDGGLPVSGYTVRANDLTSAARGGQTVSTTATDTTVTGLTPGDSYTFTLSASSLLGTGISTTSGTVTVPLPLVETPVSSPVPPSKSQISTSIGKLLSPTGAASRLQKLRKTHSYTFTYHSLESGKAVIDWYEITGKGKHKRKHVVASGSAKTSRTKIAKIKIKLNALGKRLVKADKRLKLTASVTFTNGKTKLTRTGTFTLH